MPMRPQTYFAVTSPSTLIALSDQPSKPIAKEDPQIDTGGQHIIFLGVVLLAIMVVVVIGILSPRVEHAILAAIVLSLGLIGLFFALGH